MACPVVAAGDPGAVGGIGIAVVLVTAKAVVGRQRPDPPFALVASHGYSFPSGHAGAAAVGLLSALDAVPVGRAFLGGSGRGLGPQHRLRRRGGVLPALPGVHFVTDVLAGWLLGTGWAATVALVAAWWSGPDRPRIAPAATDPDRFDLRQILAGAVPTYFAAETAQVMAARITSKSPSSMANRPNRNLKPQRCLSVMKPAGRSTAGWVFRRSRRTPRCAGTDEVRGHLLIRLVVDHPAERRERLQRSNLSDSRCGVNRRRSSHRGVVGNARPVCRGWPKVNPPDTPRSTWSRLTVLIHVVMPTR